MPRRSDIRMPGENSTTPKDRNLPSARRQPPSRESGGRVAGYRDRAREPRPSGQRSRIRVGAAGRPVTGTRPPRLVDPGLGRAVAPHQEVMLSPARASVSRRVMAEDPSGCPRGSFGTFTGFGTEALREPTGGTRLRPDTPRGLGKQVVLQTRIARNNIFCVYPVDQEMNLMIELRHEVPGRVRWHAPGLRQDARLASRAVATLKTRPGVRQVRWNQACASLAVHFDPSLVTGSQIAQQLRGLLQQDAASAPCRPVAVPRRSGSDRSAPASRPRQGPRPAQRPRHRRDLLETLGLRPMIQPPEKPSLLCRVNLRVTRWMLRTSLRAWWHEQASETSSVRGEEREATPSLSLAWAYHLSQPLLNGPPRTDSPTQRISLDRRLTSWLRRGDNRVPRLIDATSQPMA